ncbi:MAG: anti-sigma factor [Phycisphaerae bacterium]|nr:anti-sigma factor [Tepidisphaeraceae bacterium]
MNCEQRRDLMPLLLVDALDPPDATALRAHLATGCARCAAYLAEADATLAHLPFSLEPVTPRPEAKTALLVRIEAETAPAVVSYTTPLAMKPRTLRMPAWVRYVLPPAVAACLTFVVTAWYMVDSMKAQRGEFARLIGGREDHIKVLHSENATLAARMKRADDDVSHALGARKFIVLEGQAGQPRAFARAWFDPKRNAWHFRAFNLQPVGPKEAYELWFVTPYGRIVPASTFRPDERGEAYLVTTLPADVGPVAAARVTDEPSVGTFQPTGTVHLAGKAE